MTLHTRDVRDYLCLSNTSLRSPVHLVRIILSDLKVEFQVSFKSLATFDLYMTHLHVMSFSPDQLLKPSPEFYVNIIGNTVSSPGIV